MPAIVRRTRTPAPTRATPWLAFGAVFGAAIALGQELLAGNWAFYIGIAMTGACVLPLCSSLFGGLDRLILVLLVFALQLDLSFNLIYADATIAGGMQGITLSLVFLLSLACWGLWAYRRLYLSGPPWTMNPRFVRACSLFVLASALSFVNTSTRTFTVFGLFGNLCMVMIALTACHLGSTRDGIETIWKMLIVVVVMQSLVLLAQRATGVTFTLNGSVMPNRFDTGRYGGTVGYAPANVATLLMVCLFFTGQWLLSSPRWTRSFALPSFGLGALCLLLTLTRSAWIGFAGGACYLGLRAFRRGILRPSHLATIGLLGVLALGIAYGPVHQRLGDNHEAAFDERWKLNYVAWEMIKAHPVLGIGLNTAYDSRWAYKPSFFTQDDWLYIAHNQFLLVTSETGVVGLATFIWVLSIGVRNARRAMRSSDPFLSDAGHVVFTSLCAMVWGMNLDFYAGMQMYVILWFMLGLANGLGIAAARAAQSVPAATDREPAPVRARAVAV